jgi:16S rRNA (cytosine967-C5)-methyltransferase
VSGEKPREIALNVLLARNKGCFVEALLDEAMGKAQLSARDRAFLQELSYGAVRWELTLDWLIARKTAGREQQPVVQNLLRLALYQMFWLDRVPSYAAVNESVEICKRRGLHAPAKFVNAVLRGYSREPGATLRLLEEARSSDLARGHSHPAWLCRRWAERWGEEKTVRLLEWNNAPAPAFARANSLKAGPEVLLKKWEEEGVQAEAIGVDWAGAAQIFRLVSAPPVNSLESFKAGLFYVQDPSTLLAVHMLQPRPGESVLDLCAAPGGKTTHIAQVLENRGQVVARDLDSARLRMVEENAARLGASCVRTGAGGQEAEFDRVLVDAPCSNTGVMRRRVELRWRIQPEEIARLAATQAQLLSNAAAQVRPGGTLAYSTCSLEREENEAVVSEFLAANPSFSLDAERALTPFADAVDGAYCARLLRNR